MRRCVVLVLVLACGKQPTASSAEGGPLIAAKPPWPSDAPDRNAACTKHEDCTVLMHDAIVPPDPCCEQRVGFMPVSRKYAEFTRAYREKSCAGVKCNSLLLPGAEPSCCASIGRCVNEKCIAGCDDPTLDAPKVVWHDATCSAIPK